MGKKRLLDESRTYGTITGNVGHRYEQDGLRFNAAKECMDPVPKSFEPAVEKPDEDVEEPTSIVIGNPTDEEVDSFLDDELDGILDNKDFKEPEDED